MLITSYFDPCTADNHDLRQTLSYFLPVFCHSAPANALMMAQITVSEFHHLLTLRANEDSEEENLVSVTLVAAQFIDWTDPRKCSPAVKERDYTLHAIVARDVLEKVCGTCAREDRKLLILCLLAKCYLCKEAGRELLKEVHEQVTRAIDGRRVAEASAKNALARTKATVEKLLAELQEEEGGERDATAVPVRGGDNQQGEAVTPERASDDEEGERERVGREQEEEEEEEEEIEEREEGVEEEEELHTADEGARAADEEERGSTLIATEDEDGEDE